MKTSCLGSFLGHVLLSKPTCRYGGAAPILSPALVLCAFIFSDTEMQIHAMNGIHENSILELFADNLLNRYQI